MQFVCERAWGSGRAEAQTVASDRTKVARSLPQHFVCTLWTCIMKNSRLGVRDEPLTLDSSQRPGSLLHNVPVSRCQHHRFQIILSTKTTGKQN